MSSAAQPGAGAGEWCNKLKTEMQFARTVRERLRLYFTVEAEGCDKQRTDLIHALCDHPSRLRTHFTQVRPRAQLRPRPAAGRGARAARAA